MSTISIDKKVLRIGSRESELALKQTHMVRDELLKLYPDIKIEIITMKTMGDKILDVSLSKIGSKALFTKELEVALENKTIDFIVHSLKDLPTTLPDGMVIGSVLKREDPRDCVIMHPDHAHCELSTLPDEATIGTSSVRRVAQLKKNYPNLNFESIRGNLNTRLRKLDNDDKYAAIVLAVAGVKRMGWSDRISQFLENDTCMYAVGQGALALECRDDDKEIIEILSQLSHSDTLLATVAERTFMCTLEGGCSAPVAVSTKICEGTLTMKGGVWSLGGTEEIVHSMEVVLDESRPSKVIKKSSYCGIVPLDSHKYSTQLAHQLGLDLANDLLKKGAKAILDKAKAENKVVVNQAPLVSNHKNGVTKETNGVVA